MTRRLHPSLHARTRPDHPALVMTATGETVTYGQLESRTNQAAHLLRSWGLDVGDLIAIFAENHPQYLELCWAAQRSGLYFVPVSWHLTPTEVDYIVRDSGASALFVSSRFPDHAAAFAEAAPPATRLCSLGGALDGYEEYTTCRDPQPTSRIAGETAGSDMIYTSGTTGRPKGVKRPLTGAAIDIAPDHYSEYERSGFGPDTVFLAPGPLYHSAPLRTAMIAQAFGGTVVLVDRFDAEDVLRVIEEYRVTHSNWVPTHFVRLLQLAPDVRDRYDVSSLQLVLHGAAPCPVEVKEQMIDWMGSAVVEYYAGTEEFGACLITADEWLEHKGSVGKPLTAVHIVDDETGDELGPGETGTIYFENPPDVEYHNAADKTRAARVDQGWASFGDIGWVDDDGYLYLTDRKADIIISGGVNVYPQEVEQRLILHPEVVDVAVFGVPHAEFGEEVKAVVQPVSMSRAGSELERELIEFCREALATLKCPRSIDFDPALPRFENGTLYKRLLKQRYEVDRTDAV